MPKSTCRARDTAARHQNLHCYYCGLPMWSSDPAAFIAKYGITRRQALQLQCTAEHLIARCQGGSGGVSNIVAACSYCNRKRHARTYPRGPAAYRCLVERRILHGRWLVATLPESLRHTTRRAGVTK